MTRAERQSIERELRLGVELDRRDPLMCAWRARYARERSPELLQDMLKALRHREERRRVLFER